MSVLDAIRRSGKDCEVSLSERNQSIASFLPEGSSEVIDAVLKEFEVSMSSGAIKDAVSAACGALILERHRPELIEDLKLSELLNRTKKDLRFVLEAVRQCEGKPVDVAEHVLGQIQDFISPESSNQDSPNEGGAVNLTESVQSSKGEIAA